MEQQILISPNIHVAIVHFPLALLTIGALIELFSFMWRRHGFRAAGRWMILLGALLGIPTALTGTYALNDVARMGLNSSQMGSWRAAAEASTLSAAEWNMLWYHAVLASVATALAVIVVVAWIGCSDRARHNLHIPLLIVLLISVGMFEVAAWESGEAIYRHGTGVALVHGSSQSIDKPTTDHATIEATTMQSAQREALPPAQLNLNEKIAYYAPPLQLHVMFAGLTVAMAAVSIGLAIRKITQGPPVTQVDFIAAALGPPPTLLGSPSDLDESEMLNPPMSEPQDVIVPRVLVSRFWLLAFALGLITALGGAWVLATENQNWVVKDLWMFIQESPRRMGHLFTGVAILILPIILAGLARWAPRRAWPLTIFISLLLIAVVIQIWFGVLLMYDSPQGALTRFN